jgi:triacylglycerol lipase
MGGLDARQMIFTYRMNDRVVSLTTIGTPHLGTSYADWGIKRFGLLFDLARIIGLDLEGLRDLTRESCQRFNDRTRDFERQSGILYQAYAGTQPLSKVFGPLKFSYRIVWREEGENDGVVSLRSAMWNPMYFVEEIDADHFNQIGWWDGAEALGGTDRATFEKRIQEFYLRIARRLRDL